MPVRTVSARKEEQEVHIRRSKMSWPLDPLLPLQLHPCIPMCQASQPHLCRERTDPREAAPATQTAATTRGKVQAGAAHSRGRKGRAAMWGPSAATANKATPPGQDCLQMQEVLMVYASICLGILPVLGSVDKCASVIAGTL